MQESKDYGDEIELTKLFSVLWRGKYFVIIFTIFSLAFGSIYLRSLSIKYEVSILLAPVQGEQISTDFGNLGGLASLAGISLPTGGTNDFSKYKIMLNTQEISELIFKDKKLIQELFASEWDKDKEVFREPKQKRKQLVKNYFKELLTGQPPKTYEGPNPAQLKEHIQTNINIGIDRKTQYIKLSAESSEPELIAKLLTSMIYTTDALFKKKFIKHSTDAISFYQNKISKARSQEHREILATLIAKEEKKLLLATRSGPFVAEIITGPNKSLNPTYPKATLILAVSIMFGVFLSCGFLLIRNLLKDNFDE